MGLCSSDGASLTTLSSVKGRVWSTGSYQFVRSANGLNITIILLYYCCRSTVHITGIRHGTGIDLSTRPR